MDIRFLKSAATFVKDNYEPWKDLHEDDTVLWLLDSWKKRLIFPLLVGSQECTEIIALYQFWQVSPDYIRRIKFSTLTELQLPGSNDGGQELFCPLAVVGEKWRNTGLRHSWIINQKVGAQFPKMTGYHRWVLKSQRVKFIKFRR